MQSSKNGVAQKGTEKIPLKFKLVDNSTYFLMHLSFPAHTNWRVQTSLKSFSEPL